MRELLQRAVPLLRHAVMLAAVAAVLVTLSRWWTPVRVGGESMHPAMHAGDLAIVRRGAKPVVGSVALIDAPGHGAVLHRVVGTESGGRLRTRGDANPITDREPVWRASVRGTVCAVVPVGALVERWRER